MSTDATFTWTGASGTTYTYYVHALPVSFKENQDGNYIYAKTVNGKWQPIYIGRGDIGDRIGPNHHKAACISSKGATYVHVHLNAKEQDRLDEEADLLENYPQAYQPTGCNEREVG